MDAGAVAGFWSWFSSRAGDVAADPGGCISEVADRLCGVEPGLGCELGRDPDGGALLVVRTEAPELRYAAVSLIAAAPAVAGWRFSAWRAASADLSASVRFDQGPAHVFGDFTLDLREDEQYPFLHLVLSSASLRGAGEEARMAVGFIALDWILGEKLVEDAVETVDFRAAPPGAIPAHAACAEVERRLEAARARATPRRDEWAALQGELEGRPAIGRVAIAPDLAGIARHPWRVEVHLDVRRPTGDGLPEPEELRELQRIEDRIESAVRARTSCEPWGNLTHAGRRSSFVQAEDPRGLVEAIQACARESGCPATVEIYYDARWRAWRGLRGGE